MIDGGLVESREGTTEGLVGDPEEREVSVVRGRVEREGRDW